MLLRVFYLRAFSDLLDLCCRRCVSVAGSAVAFFKNWGGHVLRCEGALLRHHCCNRCVKHLKSCVPFRRGHWPKSVRIGPNDALVPITPIPALYFIPASIDGDDLGGPSYLVLYFHITWCRLQYWNGYQMRSSTHIG